jgi:glutamine amidotransferase-like uncharacterized protein
MKKYFISGCILIAALLIITGCSGNLAEKSLIDSKSSSVSSSKSLSSSESGPGSGADTSKSLSGNENSSDESSSQASSPVSSEFLPGSINIGLYSGKGSWDINVKAFRRFFEKSGYKWEEFDQKDLTVEDYLSRFDLIWFPGGFSAEYRANISVQGRGNIQNYAKNGGAIAGSCAGAYYMSDIMVWHGKSSSYPVKIFEGKAIGPLAGKVSWGGISQLKINESVFGKEFPDTLPVYYYDGPYFVPNDAVQVEVLARYAINNEAAVISGNYGKGKFLLFGPHPELGGNYSSSKGINVDGGEGAQWDWLNKSLQWFISR